MCVRASRNCPGFANNGDPGHKWERLVFIPGRIAQSFPKYRAEIFYCLACLQLVIIRPRCEACAKALAALLSENRSWEPGRAGLEIISSYSRNLDSALTVKGRGRLCEKSGVLGEGLSG